MITEKLNIPIALCSHALQYRMDRQLAVYCYFKAYSRKGYLKINPTDIQDCAAVLGVSARTVKNNLQSLIEHKWITFNPLTSYHYIIGFGQLMKRYRYKGRTGKHIDYNPSLGINDFKTFKAFLAAAKITHLQNDFRKKEWRKNEAGRTKTDPFKPYEVPQFLLSAVALSDCLGGISISKARNLKKKAKEAGYIWTQKNTCIPVNLPSADVKHLIKSGTEGTQKLIYSPKYRKYFKQLPDMVLSELKLTQRKK